MINYTRKTSPLRVTSNYSPQHKNMHWQMRREISSSYTRSVDKLLHDFVQHNNNAMLTRCRVWCANSTHERRTLSIFYQRRGVHIWMYDVACIWRIKSRKFKYPAMSCSSRSGPAIHSDVDLWNALTSVCSRPREWAWDRVRSSKHGFEPDINPKEEREEREREREGKMSWLSAFITNINM